MASHPPVQGYVDPNFSNPNGPDDAPVVIYGYTPSLALGILGAVLFGISGIIHGWPLFKYRTWYFSTVLIGIIMEVVGYLFRILSNRIDPYRVTYFVVQYFFIVVAPVFFSAAIYTVLSVLIKFVGRLYAPVAPRLILIVFITCDVVATIVQIIGAAAIGRAESDRKDPTTANNVLLAGLAFQVFSFLVFLIFLSWFLWRAWKALFKGISKAFIASFVTATLLIYLRTCYRLAQTAEGLGGTLSSHEIYFGCLEFLPVVIAIYLLAVWHPGR
ncbi:RTA1-domain-containing protein, partial [Lepidopterella palustris CBS 459.81]